MKVLVFKVKINGFVIKFILYVIKVFKVLNKRGISLIIVGVVNLDLVRILFFGSMKRELV